LEDGFFPQKQKKSEEGQTSGSPPAATSYIEYVEYIIPTPKIQIIRTFTQRHVTSVWPRCPHNNNIERLNAPPYYKII
jgi:hypothetical protein